MCAARTRGEMSGVNVAVSGGIASQLWSGFWCFWQMFSHRCDWCVTAYMQQTWSFPYFQFYRCWSGTDTSMGKWRTQQKLNSYVIVLETQRLIVWRSLEGARTVFGAKCNDLNQKKEEFHVKALPRNSLTVGVVSVKSKILVLVTGNTQWVCTEKTHLMA